MEESRVEDSGRMLDYATSSSVDTQQEYVVDDTRNESNSEHASEIDNRLKTSENSHIRTEEPKSVIKLVEKESPLLMTVVWKDDENIDMIEDDINMKDDLKNSVPSPLPSSHSKKPIVPKLRLNSAQSSQAISNNIYSDSSNNEGIRFKNINK